MSLCRNIFTCIAIFFSLVISSVCYGQIKIHEGNYLYDYAPGVEGKDSSGKSVLIPLQKGLITDGKKQPGQSVVWSGGPNEPGTVQVIFDLLQDQPISKVRVHAAAQNQWQGIYKIQVLFRADADKNYRIAGQVQWSKPVTEFDLKHQNARYIKVTFERHHPYENVPLDEVEIIADKKISASAVTNQAASVEFLKGEFNKEALMVDRYGQYLYEEWPNKVKNDSQLVNAAKEEKKRLANVKLDLKMFDKFGGRLDGGNFKATGFFRTEKIDGRWWLITPEGHKYIMTGVCGSYTSEWGYTTPIENPDKTPRYVFAELPDAKKFSEAYINTFQEPRVSFLITNLKRKYGPNFVSAWIETMQKRYLAWGFNANGKWTIQPGLVLPYIPVITSGPAGNIRYMRADDPFDPRFASLLEEGLKENLLAGKDNPWLVGITYDNENGWDYDEVIPAILKAGKESPAKCAFAKFMADRYKNDFAKINTALGTNIQSAQELVQMSLTLAQIKNRKDLSDFVRYASHEYYRQVSHAIKKYDPNHLFLGSSLVPTWRSCEEWETGGAEYLDAISLDIYQTTLPSMERYRKTDKPLLLLEYSFSVLGRGMAGVPASLVPDQKSRGLYYRCYVEQLAANPQMVGFSWFMCYDSPVTMRNLPGGESFNQGLMDVCDQPYTEMVDEMVKTNARLYDVHAGKISPVNKKELGIK